jgi:superoxide reductase
MNIGELFQSADWKSEKHVPVIECPDEAKADEVFEVTVTIGKEVAHPNTTEHHIRWIQVFFVSEGENNAYQLGNYEFSAHGESTDGADKGLAYTHHAATGAFKLKSSGTIMATSLCNIHGLWENSHKITVR